MRYGTSLYAKIYCFYKVTAVHGLGGIMMESKNLEKISLSSVNFRTTVIKVSSVKSKILFWWDTLQHTFVMWFVCSHQAALSKHWTSVKFKYGAIVFATPLRSCFCIFFVLCWFLPYLSAFFIVSDSAFSFMVCSIAFCVLCSSTLFGLTQYLLTFLSQIFLLQFS